MGLKKYIGFSLLLILIVGLYVYSIQNGNYTVNAMEYSLELPIVAWVLLPIVVLFVFSVLHLMFYGSINYCKNRGFSKDEATMLETLKAILLEKNDKKRFKTEGYKNLAAILKQFSIDVKDNTFTSKDESLNTVVSQIKDIKAGKHVSDKQLKLNLDSKLAKQNLINKINEQPDYAVDILKKATQFPSDVTRVAFFSVLENKVMTTVKKVYNNVVLDREMAIKLFIKDIENPDVGLSKEEILKIAKSLDYSKDEYITLAKLYKDGLTPDKLLELFETISNENEAATEAYLYVLFEVEMIDQARDILSGYNEDEMLAFKALLDLKEAGKHYSLDDLSI